jgi:hypothetical protein
MPVSVRRGGALAAAAVALLVAKAWLYCAPGRAVRWGSLIDLRNPRDPRPVETIRDFSAAVAAIGRRPLFSATCLEQSLALVLLLSCARVPAHLVLGVSRAASTLRAHAWVECGGAVVHGGAHVAGFAPLVPHLPASSSSVPSSCPG